MEIEPYTQDKFDQCVEIFKSNLNKYFADYELEEFKSFLNQVAHKSSYFVVLEMDEVVGCGGYEEYKNEFTLTWGMIRRDLHGKGYGKKLTRYRLNAIRTEYPNSVIRIDTSQHTQGFYEKQGFKIEAIEKDGYKPGLDKYIMTSGSITPNKAL